MFLMRQRHQSLWIVSILCLLSILQWKLFRRHEGLSCMLTSRRPDEDIAESLIANNSSSSSIEGTEIPQHIYQTWKNIAVPNPGHVNSWQQQNPDHEYTLFTDRSAGEFMQQYYGDRPDLLEIYNGLNQRILAADMLRYLIVYALGGIYTDIDTSCTRPINQWLMNERQQRDFNIVVGVEADVDWNAETLARAGFVDNIQFIQWTLMGKARHAVLNRTIEGIVAKIHSDAHAQNVTVAQLQYNETGILTTTGPWMYSRVIRQYIDHSLNRTVPNSEFHNLTEPKLFGDVLVLPVNAWSPESPHSNSGSAETSLLRHWQAGSWRKEFDEARAAEERKEAEKMQFEEQRRLSEAQLEQDWLNRAEEAVVDAEKKRKEEEEKRMQLEQEEERQSNLLKERLQVSRNMNVASNFINGTKSSEPEGTPQQNEKNSQKEVLQVHEPLETNQRQQEEALFNTAEQQRQEHVLANG